MAGKKLTGASATVGVAAIAGVGYLAWRLFAGEEKKEIPSLPLIPGEAELPADPALAAAVRNLRGEIEQVIIDLTKDLQSLRSALAAARSTGGHSGPMFDRVDHAISELEQGAAAVRAFAAKSIDVAELTALKGSTNAALDMLYGIVVDPGGNVQARTAHRTATLVVTTQQAGIPLTHLLWLAGGIGLLWGGSKIGKWLARYQ